jgi:hypothetical protein
MSHLHLPYDPGTLPTKSSPSPGEFIELEVKGLPPFKDTSRSIRNSSHPHHEAFQALRLAAVRAMDGRAWYNGPVQFELSIHAKELHPRRALLD